MAPAPAVATARTTTHTAPTAVANASAAGAKPADAEYWKIECANQTIGDEGTELDLSGVNLASGNFKNAKFIGAAAP